MVPEQVPDGPAGSLNSPGRANTGCSDIGLRVPEEPFARKLYRLRALRQADTTAFSLDAIRFRYSDAPEGS